MNLLNGQLLLLLLVIVCIAAARFESRHFLVLIKRMRLFFISIFIIYAYGTPGEYLWQSSVIFSPTYEGLNLGLMQIERLVISLAALSLLIATSAKENLIVGLYVLFSPLKLLGFQVERFAARLLLTLEYVEELASSKIPKFSFHQLDTMQFETENAHTDKVIVLQALPYRTVDKLMIVIFISIAFALIAFKVMT